METNDMYQVNNLLAIKWMNAQDSLRNLIESKLVELNSGFFYKLSNSLPNIEDREDLRQEFFQTLKNCLEYYHKTGYSFSKYLFRALVNRKLNFHAYNNALKNRLENVQTDTINYNDNANQIKENNSSKLNDSSFEIFENKKLLSKLTKCLGAKEIKFISDYYGLYGNQKTRNEMALERAITPQGVSYKKKKISKGGVIKIV